MTFSPLSILSVSCCDDLLLAKASECAHALGVELNEVPENTFTVAFSVDGVSLLDPTGKCAIRVDFCEGATAHRRLYGGGKGQMIAKAVGVSSKLKPSIFDATAGLGKDAFVLASLGCELTLMERSPVAFYLLEDGLSRGREYAQASDPELLNILSRMNLIAGNSIDHISSCGGPVADVIYLDPMFPSRQKKAEVKKEMKAFHSVVGQDVDHEDLFASAQNKAVYRIVVKRPRLAPTINNVKPSYNLEGKSSRYDIYTYKGMTT